MPGATGTTPGTYAIELLRASTSPGSANCSTSDPAGTMLEGATSGAPGTFRIRSTGYAGDSKQSIVATLKRRSFLDYIYFTQLETSDPVTYGDAATIAGAYTQCTKKVGPNMSTGRYAAADSRVRRSTATSSSSLTTTRSTARFTPTTRSVT